MRVTVNDAYWSPRIDFVCREVIPYQYEVLSDNVEGIEKSHAIENFKIAAGISKGEFHGMLFQDSDVGKWIEAAAYSLEYADNKALENKIDDIVDILEKAQQHDGYLNTYYTCCKPGERFTNISHGHELYCAGHLLEGAIAYFSATGKRKFLKIMESYIEYLINEIGTEDGKRHVFPGHPEIELALLKFYDMTGDSKYLAFADYLLTERGTQPSFLEKEPTFGDIFKDQWFALPYHQAHKPVVQQREAVGHAVRAMYLYTAMAGMARIKNDAHMGESLNELWNDVTRRKMYITGAVGSEEHGECFSSEYDLPNDRAYAETCASIGLIFWAKKMMELEPDGKYADVMETALYNGASSGMSRDGKHYFYINPLMVIPRETENRYDMRHVKTQRVAWFGCACCPTNIARLLASLGTYIYHFDTESVSLYVQLYIGSELKLDPYGIPGSVIAQSGLPCDGRAQFMYSGKCAEFSICLRIPQWSESYTITVNGQDVTAEYRRGFAELKRIWNHGDCIEIRFNMKAKLMYANPLVSADAGRAAVVKGPVVYCAEEADNGSYLCGLILDSSTVLQEDDGGTILAYGYREVLDGWDKKLYSDQKTKRVKTSILFVPYYSWGNRGKGEMAVWLRAE